jgi:hypothetical protein
MKLALAFLAGVMVMAVECYVAGVRFAAPMFIAGAVFVLAPLVGMLSSVKRVRMVVRFLSAFAHAWEKRLGTDTLETAGVDPLAADVASALVNQGVPKKAAAAAADQAVKSNRDLDSAFRAALKLIPRKVA